MKETRHISRNNKIFKQKKIFEDLYDFFSNKYSSLIDLVTMSTYKNVDQLLYLKC